MIDDIPQGIRDYMNAGFCPVCKKSMYDIRGKPTHDITQRKYCEKTLRKWLGITKQRVKLGGKTYEIDARFVDSQSAKEMKDGL